MVAALRLSDIFERTELLAERREIRRDAAERAKVAMAAGLAPEPVAAPAPPTAAQLEDEEDARIAGLLADMNKLRVDGDGGA